MQLEREGYSNTSPEEAELYSLVGSKIFYKVVEQGFSIAYWVNKYFELGDEETKLTYVNNRKEMVRSVLEMARKGPIEYYPIPESQLVRAIRDNVAKQARQKKRNSKV